MNNQQIDTRNTIFDLIIEKHLHERGKSNPVLSLLSLPFSGYIYLSLPLIT
jgi:hypothetical protein